MKPSWRDVARKEGRVCPECGRPVPRKYWKPGLKQCYNCFLGHRGVSGVGAGSSVEFQNRDFESEFERRQ